MGTHVCLHLVGTLCICVYGWVEASEDMCEIERLLKKKWCRCRCTDRDKTGKAIILRWHLPASLHIPQLRP